jgi:fructokinase
MSSEPVLCVGEVLWDCLPRGLFLGGAPLNVAYHLHNLGRPSAPVSAVGGDFLGAEILRRLASWDLPCDFVPQVDKPTGVVQVELIDGQPSYQIVDDVAWDAIPSSPALLEAAEQAPALVFGSLASRHAANRQVIGELIERCPGITVLDVNLRSPHDDLDLVRDFGAHSRLIKLNHEELGRLASGDDNESRARALREEFGCERICVTAGASGAGLLDGTQWHWEPGRSVQVKDTVGAGDSFMAALLDGLLAGAPIPVVLRRAARLAEFVASSDGATPDHADAPSSARQLG